MKEGPSVPVSHETWKDIMRSYAKLMVFQSMAWHCGFAKESETKVSLVCLARFSTGGELGFVLVTAQADCPAHVLAVGDKCGLAEHGG